ncbi:hypothetical protein RDWZM_001029 [Blomia tropicalis]|uniref:Peptidyl-prolyl cis-trans isomerase n=1 Tax=Blomia tropicalis TaxID=40697 RepID=A0A9Q0MBP4_BLOTA|nr:hypothetical protein RDWZM_001029 [Blomia tropicalis]
MSVVIETTLGDITVDLFITDRPQTCQNFLKLCAIKYYNHCSFHFVQRDFIAQTGDPTGTGRGGESVYSRIGNANGSPQFIVAETKPKIKHDRFGLISMVNNGDGGHGSQFFFTLCHSLDYLDGFHTVFGEVAEGEDVLIKLNDTICDEKHQPYQDILITHTVILDDPFPDIEGLEIPPKSPEYNFDELIKSDRIGVGEAIVDEDKPVELIEEELKEKDAKQRALVLEMIGDLPDADVAPPENILFVCKLNPVTREEDLEIIFSRFGTIVSCEVIRDETTGESLQYAFIEFENKDDCEKAYFKMDNVLIDDRRIHVDFSQSVSKYKWKGKGRGVIVKKEDDKPSKTRHPERDNNDRSRNDYRPNYRNEREYDDRKIHRSDKKRERESRDYRDRDRNHSRTTYSRTKENEKRDRHDRHTSSSSHRHHHSSSSKSSSSTRHYKR